MQKSSSWQLCHVLQVLVCRCLMLSPLHMSSSGPIFLLTGSSTPCPSHCSSSLILAPSFELQQHVVLGREAHAGAEHVLQRCTLLGQSIDQWVALRDQGCLRQVGQQDCHRVEATQLFAVLGNLQAAGKWVGGVFS